MTILTRDKLDRIKNLKKYYPEKFFKEPTKEEFDKAHKILKEHGISLSCISASNMRHILTVIEEIIKEK